MNRVLVFGPTPMLESFVEFGPDYDDYKIVGVEPALEHGYEINWGDSLTPRAWWVNLEDADPEELRRWHELRDDNLEQHRSMWQQVKSALR